MSVTPSNAPRAPVGSMPAVAGAAAAANLRGSQPAAGRSTGGGSLLARPTGASQLSPGGMSSAGSVIGGRGGGSKRRKEPTFRQQLLTKTLKESHIRPCGVLAVHIKRGNIHEIDPGGHLFHFSDTVAIYLRLHSSWQCKTTGMFVNLSTPVMVTFDDLIQFDFTVKPRRSNIYYFFRIEIVAFDLEHPEVHHILAMKELSQLDLVRSRYSERNIELWKLEKLVAELSCEFAFAYGTLGFGYCNVFKWNSLRPARELIEYSMFCRLPPFKSRTFTPEDETMVCSWKRVTPPEILYLAVNVTFTLDAPQTNVGSKMRLGSKTRQLQQQQKQSVIADDGTETDPADVPMTLALLSSRLLARRAEYCRLTCRRDRLAFLHRHAVVGALEAQSAHGGSEKVFFDADRQPKLRRRRHLGHDEPRPPDVFAVRPGDRRWSVVNVLSGALPPDVVLLDGEGEPAAAADDDDDEDEEEEEEEESTDTDGDAVADGEQSTEEKQESQQSPSEAELVPETTSETSTLVPQASSGLLDRLRQTVQRKWKPKPEPKQDKTDEPPNDKTDDKPP